jgi:hypothetical protein
MGDQHHNFPITLFYSYAHEDEALCRELDKHLSLLQRQGIIHPWHDRMIVPGTNRANAIDSHLKEAAIILLLVSPDFLASDYCYQVEMQHALKRHKVGEVCVIPIILRPVDWHESPLASLECLPRSGKPVTEWENQDVAFHTITEGIRTVIKKTFDLNHARYPLKERIDRKDLKIRAVSNADRSISITYILNEREFFTSQVISRDTMTTLALISRDFPRVHYRFGTGTTWHMEKIARRISSFLLPPQISEQLRTGQIQRIQILLEETDPPLPWNLLHDGQQFVGLQMPIVNTPIEIAANEVEFQPKTLLLIEGLPDAYGYSFDDFQNRYMQEMAKGWASVKRVQAESAAQLKAIISHQEFDTIHLCSHSVTGSDLRLILGQDQISAKELYDMFSEKQGSKLITLAACETGNSFPYDQPSFKHNLAYLLSRLGWYVIGSVGWLEETTEFAYAEAFYEALAIYKNVETAVYQAKRSIADKEWWGFTLFGPMSNLSATEADQTD